MIARIVSLSAGSSGMFMIMAGLERKELKIQLINAILITLIAIVTIQQFGLLAIVSLFICSSFLVNITQLCYISKTIRVSPFTKELLLLYVISAVLIYYSIIHDLTFSLHHYIVIPLLLYFLFTIIFYGKIKLILKSIRND